MFIYINLSIYKLFRNGTNFKIFHLNNFTETANGIQNFALSGLLPLKLCYIKILSTTRGVLQEARFHDNPYHFQ